MAHHDPDQEIRQDAQKMKREAKDMAQTAKSQAKDIKQDVKSDAQDIKQQAEQKANSFVDQKSSAAAQQLNPISDALRQTGNQLEEQNTPLAQYAHQAADQVEMIQNYLNGANLNQIASDAREMAREQPELFVGAAFTAGLMLARFFKSSSSSTGQNRQNYSNQGMNRFNTGSQYQTSSYEYRVLQETPTTPPYPQRARMVPLGEENL